jgi:hypothetical protein
MTTPVESNELAAIDNGTHTAHKQREADRGTDKTWVIHGYYRKGRR